MPIFSASAYAIIVMLAEKVKTTMTAVFKPEVKLTLLNIPSLKINTVRKL